LARRANALALLDDGMSCEAIAKVLLLDDDTIRTWYRLYEEDGIEGLASFGYEGGACRLNEEQQDKLKPGSAIRCRGRHARSAPGSRRNAASSTRAGLA
jgi:transposase